MNKWVPILIGAGVASVAIYLVYKYTVAGKAPGERSYPPYQNQLETYNPSGYAEDLYSTKIAFAQAPGYGMELNMGMAKGQKGLHEGETRSF